MVALYGTIVPWKILIFLESIQVEAAKIHVITGLRKKSSKKKTLYQELGWDLLNTIRDQQKFLVFDIYKAHRLQYLPPIFRIFFYPSIPQHVVTTSKTLTILIFLCHNWEQFHIWNSYLPSSIKFWNSYLLKYNPCLLDCFF